MGLTISPSGGVSQAYVDAADLNLQIQISNLAISFGTYSPLFNNIANTDSLTAYNAQYLGISATVTVSGRVDVTFTVLTPTLIQFESDLPIPSLFNNDFECGGVGAGNAGLLNIPVSIYANVSDRTAQFDFVATPSLGGALTIYYSYTYQIA